MLQGTAKIIADYGVSLAVVIIFLWMVVSDISTRGKKEKEQRDREEARDKQYNESLRLIAKATDNVSAAIGILNDKFVQHDERAIQIMQSLVEVNMRLNVIMQMKKEG